MRLVIKIKVCAMLERIHCSGGIYTDIATSVVKNFMASKNGEMCHEARLPISIMSDSFL